MTFKCAFCDKDEWQGKWFVCPGAVYRPNQYSVCEEHQNMSLRYEDVYKSNDAPPIIRHEYKLKENSTND